MLSESLRGRIAALSRSALRLRPATPCPGPLSAEDGPAQRPPSSVAGHPFAGPGDVRIRSRLEEVSPRGEVVENALGSYYLIDRPMADLLPGQGVPVEALFARTFNGFAGGRAAHDPFETFRPLGEANADSVLFVDIEATGFTAGTPLFLIGVLHGERGSVRVRQFLARDYTEEAPLLRDFAAVLARSRVVMSFNGKSYDVPYIRERMVYHGLPFPAGLVHIDVLHEGRRRFRGRLPNCRLQTLERAICRRGRVGDIPGAEIPDVYHRFVRTGNAKEMEDVLHHNAMDLVTLAEVVLFMLEGRTL